MSIARPPELDDLDWLREQYRTKGDRTIAAELGIARSTVMRARRRFGLAAPSGVGGRRRGVTLMPAPVTVPVLDAVIDRYQLERTLDEGPAPSVQLVITRARDTVLAFHDGAPDLIAEALEALAVSALLALDHEQQRRAAA